MANSSNGGHAAQVFDANGLEIHWYRRMGQPVNNWAHAQLAGTDVWVTPDTHQLVWRREEDYGDYEGGESQGEWVLYLLTHEYLSPEATEAREQAARVEEARQAEVEARNEANAARLRDQRRSDSHANPDAGEASNPDGAWGTSSGEGWMVD